MPNILQVTHVPFGIKVGFEDGPLGTIAGYHQTGGKHLPKREILVQPDAPTIAAMRNDLETAVRTAIRAATS